MSHSPLRYRADIDGLRAVAVLPVVLFHAGAEAFAGGFVGVDVFFVISGYVIALSLLGDLEAGRFSLLGFYERRIRRILPALTATFLATFVGAWIFVLPPHFETFSKSLFYASVFASNFFFMNNAGYFNIDWPFRPLLHTWSLAVEEQYYIVVPIALFVIFRFLKRRWLLLIGLPLLASLAYSVWSTDRHPDANFFMLSTRAWELLIGALLAVRPPPPLSNRPAREALGAAALLLVAAPVFLYSKATPFPGLAALAPCLGAALLIYVGGSAPTVVTKALSIKPLVWIGLISYSLYLIHWPLVVFARYVVARPIGPLDVAALFVASLLLAWASYAWIEQPFRRKPAPRRLVFAMALAAIAVCAALGIAGARYNGFPQRFPGVDTRPDPSEAELLAQWRTGQCFFWSSEYWNWRAEACTIGPAQDERVLLWGDSFATSYTPALKVASGRLSAQYIQYSSAGCPPVISLRTSACRAFNLHALDYVKREHIKHVVLAANWSEYAREEIAGIRDTVSALKALGVDTTVIGQTPTFAIDVHIIGLRRGTMKAKDAYATIEQGPELNAFLRPRVAGARFIDPLPYLCRGLVCPYRLNGEYVYLDKGHFTPKGASYGVDAYLPFVGPAASPRAVQPAP